jgi:hypothetical protein
MMLRYYQALLNCRSECEGHIEMAKKEGIAIPHKIAYRVLFTPDQATYICSAEKMLGVHFLDVAVIWDRDVKESDEEWWADNLETGVDFDYLSWHSVVDKYDKDDRGKVTFRHILLDYAFQGEYEDKDDGEKEAIEHACAQELV